MTKKELYIIIEHLNQRLDAAMVEIALLKEENLSLKEEIRVLKAGKNSSNSSKPPSSNIVSLSRSLREKSVKLTGGQIGHEGKTLEFKAIPDFIEKHIPDFCTSCGQDISSNESFIQEKRQVVDIPPVSAIFTEHRIYKKICSCGKTSCGTFPQQVKASIQYGARIESMIAYMSTRQYVPYARISEYFKQIHQLPISEGTIDNCLKRFHQKALSFYQTIKSKIYDSLFVGGDETGCKINGEKYWIWVWQTTHYNYITVSKSRGSQAVLDEFPQGLPNCILTSDAWAAQLATKAKSHQLCTAHLMRDLKYFIETFNCDWSNQINQVFKDAIKLKGELQKEDYCIENQKIIQIENRINLLLENEELDKKEVKSFRKRLVKNRMYLFEFLKYQEVEPDNNSSERAIRNVKVKQKISNQFKTVDGAKIFVVIRSIIDTAIKNNLNIFDTLFYISNLRAE